MQHSHAVLITGATGGLGRATAEKFVGEGWHVYAADCNELGLSQLSSNAITPIFMDVADKESVSKALQLVKEKQPFIDGVINFAGILRVGSMAELDDDTLQSILNINVMGTYRVNKAFIPLLSEGEKRGRIVNISSETGWQSGAPFNGAYAMSKHAIEAYSDSLRRELMFLDIPVIKVQPGPFKTEMVASIEKNFDAALSKTRLFQSQLATTKRLALKEQGKAHSPDHIAEVLFNILTCKKPKAAYSIKADPMRSLLEYLPTSLADLLLRKVLG
ncbi:MAG: SDR family NAD(P)-dependent oxidoreductase, partial [Spongiibacteraceae bacterium]